MSVYTQKHLDLAEGIQRFIRERKGETTAMQAMAEMLCVFEVAVIGQCAMIAKEMADQQKHGMSGIVANEIANRIADLIGPAAGAVIK